MVRSEPRPILPRILLAVAVSSMTSAGAPHASPEKIGPGIREATARGESPRVLLYLDLPPVSPADLPRLKREVAGVQERVLGRLDHREFVLERRFATIPVLAG